MFRYRLHSPGRGRSRRGDLRSDDPRRRGDHRRQERALPCRRRGPVRGGGRVAVRRTATGRSGLERGIRRGEIGAARRPKGQGHPRPVAARAPSACGRQPASRRRLLVRLVESSPSRRFTNDLLPAAGASYEAGQEDGGRAGLRRSPCLRSGRGGGDVTASHFPCSGSVRVLVAMPFDEEDESPFVGLLQVVAA